MHCRKILFKKCKSYLWINAYMHLVQFFKQKTSFALKNIYFLQKLIFCIAIEAVPIPLSSQRITTLHIIKEHFRSTYFIACENSQHFMTQPVVSTRNDIWGMSAENSILIIHHYLHVHLGSASDWLKFASTKHKHYPDMGSDVLSAWNLCAILWRNLWWCRKVLPVFSSYIF